MFCNREDKSFGNIAGGVYVSKQIVYYNGTQRRYSADILKRPTVGTFFPQVNQFVQN
jgi:hypothetical protein